MEDVVVTWQVTLKGAIGMMNEMDVKCRFTLQNPTPASYLAAGSMWRKIARMLCYITSIVRNSSYEISFAPELRRGVPNLGGGATLMSRSFFKTFGVGHFC